CCRGRGTFHPRYTQLEHNIGRDAMPILQSFGPSAAPVSAPPPAPALSPAARRLGVLPMPSLEWNAQVERETAPLYARIAKVVPAIEWPFFAPYVKAINALKKER